MGKILYVFLIGKPNCGKSTFFNAVFNLKYTLQNKALLVEIVQKESLLTVRIL